MGDDAPSPYTSSYEHPYLLADNRHYPFYLWKNVFRSHSQIRYGLLPLYSLSVLAIIYTLCEYNKCTRHSLCVCPWTMCILCFCSFQFHLHRTVLYILLPHVTMDTSKDRERFMVSLSVVIVRNRPCHI